MQLIHCYVQYNVRTSVKEIEKVVDEGRRIHSEGEHLNLYVRRRPGKSNEAVMEPEALFFSEVTDMKLPP